MFIVSTVRDTGTISYYCASPRHALEKLNDFRRAEYWSIEIAGTDNNLLSESALEVLAGDESGSIDS